MDHDFTYAEIATLVAIVKTLDPNRYPQEKVKAVIHKSKNVEIGDRIYMV